MSFRLYMYFLVGSLLFFAQITAGNILFSHGCGRRQHFAVRAVLSCIIGFAAVALITLGYAYLTLLAVAAITAFISIPVYLLLFAVSLVVFAVCTETDLMRLIASGVASYAVQHMLYSVVEIVISAAGMSSFIFDSTLNYFLAVLMQCGIYIAGYIVIYFTFVRGMSELFYDDTMRGGVLVLSAVLLMVALVFNGVRLYFSAESLGLNILACLFAMVCSVFILIIRAGLFTRARMRRETDLLERLMREERKQFELTKEHIDLINIKCHDIRHKLSEYGYSGRLITNEDIDELKSAISVYDAFLRTGNETLDVVLTERSLYCESRGIKLTCSADGGRLDFMSASDISSLFCNAIDNAIEATVKLADPEKRVISIVVKEAVGQISVLVENWYGGEVRFEGDMPVTDKADKTAHGYGVLSMRAIVAKYGGTISFGADGGIFRMTAMLPLP